MLSCTWVRSHLEEIKIRSHGKEMPHFFSGVREQNPVLSQAAVEFDWEANDLWKELNPSPLILGAHSWLFHHCLKRVISPLLYYEITLYQLGRKIDLICQNSHFRRLSGTHRCKHGSKPCCVTKWHTIPSPFSGRSTLLDLEAISTKFPVQHLGLEEKGADFPLRVTLLNQSKDITKNVQAF